MIARWLLAYLPKYYIGTVEHSILVIILSPKSFLYGTLLACPWVSLLLPCFLCDQRRARQPKTLVKSSDGGTSNAQLDQNLNSTSVGQHLLRTLASPSSVRNGIGANEPSYGQLPVVGRVTESKQSGGQDTDSQVDTASAISEVLHSTELNGLLSGFSQQTGVGSPDVLRNMLQQLTQSPQIMNTVNQIAQQIDTQDVGNMFSGLGGGRAGGMDLSRMVQQMMPVVSQALGHRSAPQLFCGTPQRSERRSSGVDNPDDPIQVCTPSKR